MFPAAPSWMVSDLAADIRAYLEGRVVGAYESGVWAEARKWFDKAIAADPSYAPAWAGIADCGSWSVPPSPSSWSADSRSAHKDKCKNSQGAAQADS